MQRRELMKAAISSILVAGAARSASAQPAASGEPTPPRRPPFRRVPVPPVFFTEAWQRPGHNRGQNPVSARNVSNPDLELKVYGTDAKDLQISGEPNADTDPFNLWTGLCTAPVAATLRHKRNYVDLTGFAKVRWITRASGFHAVRPVVKLADGTILVGDHADSNTMTFLETEVAFGGLRWIKLDPQRVVTVGTYGAIGQASAWYTNPDLSKVDEVGFADLMPGSGHGSGGWVNLARITVYGKALLRAG